MAGITTNTTQADLTSTVVIPELTSNEATIQNLTTQVSIPGLVSVTPTPSLVSATSTQDLTTATDEPVSDVTSGKFARGLDAIASIDSTSLSTTKVFSDFYSVLETFSTVMAYVREITDTLSTADQHIQFTANSVLVDIGTTIDSPEFVLRYGREYLDSVIIADIAPKFRIAANYQDSTSIGEYFTKAMTFIRSISGTDTTNIQDIFDKAIGVNLLEQNNVSEFTSKSVNYIVTDNTLSSILTADYSASLLKYLEDYINIATEAPITPYKYFVEPVSIAVQTETVWNIFRDFVDFVDATDDYYGAANLDDDQYASFNKTVSDWLSVQDSVLTSLGRLVIDQFNSTEISDFSVGKTLLDATTSSILIQNTIGKQPQDLVSGIDSAKFSAKPVNLETVTTSDTFDRSLGRLLTETESVLDTPAITAASVILESVLTRELLLKRMIYSRLLDDNTQISDTIYNFNVSTYLSDTVAFADSANIQKYSLILDMVTSSDNFSRQVDYIRQFSDLLDATDDYYGAATVGDDEYVSLLKRIVDSAVNQEQVNIDTTIVVLDTILNSSNTTISVQKPVVDTGTISLVNINDVYKYLIETSGISETKSLVVTKPLEELLALTESFATYSAYTRSITDTINNNSYNTITIDSAKSDSYSIADAFSSITQYVRSFAELKTFSETNLLDNYIAKIDAQTITENISTEYGRAPIVDQIFNSDSITNQVSYIRQFSELVDITDDYYGAATVGDDEYVTLNKAVNEYLQLQDSQYISLAASITKTDNTIITAPVYLNVNKPVTDIAISTSTDVFSNYYKVNIESKTITELTSNTVYTIYSDSNYISDYANILLTGIRSFTETLSSTEYLINNPSLVKADQKSVTDSFSNITNFVRQFTETQTTSELQYFNALTYYIDNITRLDTARLSVNKLLFDAFSKTDVFSTQVSYIREFSDLLDATDDYYGAATVGDDEYASVNKTIVDLAHIAEQATPVNFTLYNNNSDQASSTEQKYLQININSIADYYTKSDLQYSLIGKNWIDTTYNFENVQLNIGTNYSDSISTSDVFSYSNGTYRDYIDSITNSDDLVLEARPVLVDTTNTSETHNIFFLRKPIDILQINSSSDRRYIQIGKNLDNTNNIAYLNSNSIYLAPNKGVQDQNFVFDFLQTSLTASFGLYDTIHPTDDYYGAANIDDDEYAQFNKTSSDNYSVVDYPRYTTTIQKTELLTNFEQKILTTAKNSLDTATISENLTYYKYAGAGLFIDQTLTSDSGTVNNQNYFASTYVAPGYAGTNRTIGS